MPQIRIRNAAGAIQTVKRIRLRDATGVLRTIQRVRIRDATNTLRTVFNALSATAGTPADGTAASSPVTSIPSAVTVTGGVAPFTYLWREYQNDPAYNPDGINIVSPTASSTTFRRTMVAPDTIGGSFECVVTDALGTSVVTNLVSVTLTRT